ncbi:hypothetical protein L6452_06620 [Arctium lappa]|uniref:Uncharacterized protein n=1 Tax=Arctium lappa TaxID=4217 RepID=A0ACB9EJP2_ARCLA|nr:hypothetical protein L6452_06620 [Arctium lappa]
MNPLPHLLLQVVFSGEPACSNTPDRVFRDMQERSEGVEDDVAAANDDGGDLKKKIKINQETQLFFLPDLFKKILKMENTQLKNLENGEYPTGNLEIGLLDSNLFQEK